MSLNGGGKKKLSLWLYGIRVKRELVFMCVFCYILCMTPLFGGARCSSMVRVFTHGAMGRRIDPSWWTH